MRESFVFYNSFDEALRELPDKARLKLYDAIMAYALRGEETEFTGIEKAVFSLIKPQLKANRQRYENGCKGAESGSLGGRPKKPQRGLENEENENPKKPPRKPQENPKKTPNENVNVNVNDISPLFIPPQGEKTNEFEDRFFEKYPKYAKSKGKTEGIDFEKLLVEFEKSKYLQSLYTFKQVNDIYEGIIQGLYRDKTTPIDDANARAERERWYANRRNTAINRAEAIKDKLMQRKDFFEVNGKLAEFPIALARAAIYGDEGLEAKLQEEEKHWQGVRDAILEEEGYTSEDLLPKWHCAKCEDTGFLASGKACDCYGGKND